MAESGAMPVTQSVTLPDAAAPQGDAAAPQAGRAAVPRRSWRRGDGRRPRLAQVRLSEAEYAPMAAAAARAGLSVPGFLAKAGSAVATGSEAPGQPVTELAREVAQLRGQLGRVGATLNWLKTQAAVGRPVTAAQLDAALGSTRRLLDRVGEAERALSRRVR